MMSYCIMLAVLLVLLSVGSLVLVASFRSIESLDQSKKKNNGCLFRFRIRAVRHSNMFTSIIENGCFTNCCVFVSDEFPNIAADLAERLSLPLLTKNDINHPSTEQQPIVDVLSHALIVEPNSFSWIQNYSIGIIYFNEVVVSRSSSSPKRQPLRISNAMKPLFIDFMPPPNSRLGRRNVGDSGPDLLIKAINPRRRKVSSTIRSIRTNASDLPESSEQQEPFIIYDLTAGFGQDALLMAHAVMHNNGKVHMVERNQIIATLLSDAIRRLQLISEQLSTSDAAKDTATRLYNCLSLEWNDGNDVIANIVVLNQSPDVIYLDPMFPIRKKSASVKKNMQILHSLLETQTITKKNDESYQQYKNEEESILLRTAYEVVKSRVVVKRPIQAPPLIGTIGGSISDHRCHPTNPQQSVRLLHPTYQILGSISRWDVYSKHIPTKI
jgi:hypothetical protein